MRKQRDNKIGMKKTAPSGAGNPREGRLAQWSRRKADARTRISIPMEQAIDDQHVLPLNDKSVDDELLKTPTDDDMQPLESLDEHSDYSAFLSPGVSEKLRKLALRKLFHLDMYNFADGLDDYAEDYTKFAPLKNILTADMKLQQQRAEKLLKEQSMAKEGNAGNEELASHSETESIEQLDQDATTPTDDSDATRIADIDPSENSAEDLA